MIFKILLLMFISVVFDDIVNFNLTSQFELFFIIIKIHFLLLNFSRRRLDDTSSLNLIIPQFVKIWIFIIKV